mgnify:CR=1 FL=1
MRFYFDIDDGVFEDEYGVDFRKEVADGCIATIADHVMAVIPEMTSSEARQIIRDHSDQIIEAVIQRVASSIESKRQIKSMVPSASELASADREVQKYFEKMIDKAIARKFK